MEPIKFYLSLDATYLFISSAKQVQVIKMVQHKMITYQVSISPTWSGAAHWLQHGLSIMCCALLSDTWVRVALPPIRKGTKVLAGWGESGKGPDSSKRGGIDGLLREAA